MVRVRRVAPVLALVCGLALVGCGSGADDTSAAPPAGGTPTSAAPTASGQPSGPAASVPEQLAFTGTTVDGTAFDAASLAGKPVVLWFWAPWCPKCRAAGPDVARVASRHEGRVAVVGLAGLSDDDRSMRDFVARTKTAGLTHLADPTGSLWKRFGVTSQHTFVLLRADGTVAHTGPLSADELATRVADLAG